MQKSYYISIFVILLCVCVRANHKYEFSRTLRNTNEFLNEECQFVNSLFKEDESYNCCLNEEIKCTEDNHILEIKLDNNYIENRTLPNSVGSMPYLEKLDISNCGLNGAIPEDIGELSNLKYLFLDRNEFTGPIPTSIGKLSKLEILSLYINDLSGEIPTKELEKLNVIAISLENNINLYGKIPNIKYKESDDEDLPKTCEFGGTSLCYSENEKDPDCTYPDTHYDCSTCVDSSKSSVINGICRCNEAYQGIGYIECINKSNNNNNEKGSINDDNKNQGTDENDTKDNEKEKTVTNNNNSDPKTSQSTFSLRNIKTIFTFANFITIIFFIIIFYFN